MIVEMNGRAAALKKKSKQIEKLTNRWILNAKSKRNNQCTGLTPKSC